MQIPPVSSGSKCCGGGSCCSRGAIRQSGCGRGGGSKTSGCLGIHRGTTIEAFHVSILHGLARIDVAQFDTARGSPCLQRLRSKLRPIVEGDPRRLIASGWKLVEDADDAFAGQGGIDFDRQTFAGAVVNDVERTDASPIGQLIMNKIP